MFVWFDDNQKIYSVTKDKCHIGPHFIAIHNVDALESDKTLPFTEHKESPFGGKLYLTDNNQETSERFTNGKANTAITQKTSFTRKVKFLQSPSEWNLQEVIDVKYADLARNFGFSSFWASELIDLDVINLENSLISTSTKGISIAPHGVMATRKITLDKKNKSAFLYVEAIDKSLKYFYKTEEDAEYTLIENGDFIFEGKDVWIKLLNEKEYSIPLNAFAILH